MLCAPAARPLSGRDAGAARPSRSLLLPTAEGAPEALVLDTGQRPHVHGAEHIQRVAVHLRAREAMSEPHTRWSPPTARVARGPSSEPGPRRGCRTSMFSVWMAEVSGRKSRRLSRSSSCSFREMPRTGPRWMRFIRCVVKPAILFRRRCGEGGRELSPGTRDENAAQGARDARAAGPGRRGALALVCTTATSSMTRLFVSKSCVSLL